MHAFTRSAAVTGVGLLTTTTLFVIGAPPGTSSSASAAPATCHGTPAMVVSTQKQADAAGTAGNDVVLLQSGVTFDGGPGADSICVGAEVGSLYTPLIDAGPGNDWVRGGRFHDSIEGGAGDDRVDGRGGSDFLAGDYDFVGKSDGADVVIGGRGNDDIEGQVTGRADVLRGGPGRDILKFETADPALRLGLGGSVRARAGGRTDRFTDIEEQWGSPKADLVLGTNGRDTYSALGGADLVRARAGNDHITTNQGTVYAGPGDDWVSDDSDRGRTTAWLGDGDDVAYSWSGNGPVHAGRGDDRIKLGLISGKVRMHLRGDRGRDTLTWSSCAADLDNRAGRFRCGKQVQARVIGLELFAADVCSDYYPTCGKRGYDDVLRGNRRNEVFRGAGGEDRIFGRRGRDLLFGGNGRDRGWGGPAPDRCRLVEVRHSCG